MVFFSSEIISFTGVRNNLIALSLKVVHGNASSEIFFRYEYDFQGFK